MSSKISCSHSDSCDHDCLSSNANPSVQQSLDEMEFERSIWQAAIDNDVAKISRFVQIQGVSVDSVDNYGYTALTYAARHKSEEAAQYLLRLGANINFKTRLGSTPLMRAVTSKSKEMVQLFISHGADINVKDDDGKTALDKAKELNLPEIITLLKEKDR